MPRDMLSYSKYSNYKSSGEEKFISLYTKTVATCARPFRWLSKSTQERGWSACIQVTVSHSVAIWKGHKRLPSSMYIQKGELLSRDIIKRHRIWRGPNYHHMQMQTPLIWEHTQWIQIPTYQATYTVSRIFIAFYLRFNQKYLMGQE